MCLLIRELQSHVLPILNKIIHMRDEVECFQNRKKSLVFIGVVSHVGPHVRLSLDCDGFNAPRCIELDDGGDPNNLVPSPLRDRDYSLAKLVGKPRGYAHVADDP